MEHHIVGLVQMDAHDEATYEPKRKATASNKEN